MPTMTDLMQSYGKDLVFLRGMENYLTKFICLAGMYLMLKISDGKGVCSKWPLRSGLTANTFNWFSSQNF